MFGLPGGVEWLIILLIALLLFGSRLPQVMRNLGKGITEFKKGVKGVESDLACDVDEELSKKKVPQSESKGELSEAARQEGLQTDGDREQSDG